MEKLDYTEIILMLSSILGINIDLRIDEDRQEYVLFIIDMSKPAYTSTSGIEIHAFLKGYIKAKFPQYNPSI